MREKYIIEEERTVGYTGLKTYLEVFSLPVKEGKVYVLKYFFECTDENADQVKIALNTQKSLKFLDREFLIGPHRLAFGNFSNEFTKPWVIHEGKSLEILCNNPTQDQIKFTIMLELEYEYFN